MIQQIIIKKFALFNKELKNYTILKVFAFKNFQIMNDLNSIIDEKDMKKKTNMIIRAK